VAAFALVYQKVNSAGQVWCKERILASVDGIGPGDQDWGSGIR
jgi:hypothetical protein